jgi:hypothetical protein
MDRVGTAVQRAYEFGQQPPREVTATRAPTCWLAVGDPQSSPERFFTFLDRAGALGDDGMLRPDMGLLSIGDHFDYGKDARAAARDGLAILRWLVEHPASQTVLIAGNHDLCRVGELAFETDESFAEARQIGEEVLRLDREDPGSPRIDELSAAFAERFPNIPGPRLAGRDFNGFTTAQRAMVQSLLLQRRFALAATGEVEGAPALFVHAGVGPREVALLNVEGPPETIARAINGWLDRAVDAVATTWSRGEPARLELAPLHIAGTSGAEGGGFLYHRPVNPERTERPDPERPRRFDARALPRDLLQVVGHTAHKKSREELQPWVSERAAAIENGGIRTLRVTDEGPCYDMGVLPHERGAATMIMIDAGMSDPNIAEYPLLPITNVQVPR